MEELINKARIGSAKELARSIIKKCKIKVAPVSLRAVISHLQKTHDLSVYPSANFSDQLSGILITVEDESSKERRDEIHYNENQSWHRKRFSIAHEIGHLLFNTTHDVTGSGAFSAQTLNEVEANHFASELLMPLAFLRKDLKKPGVDIAQLAWQYIVSQEAMGWKISSTNLLAKL